MKYIALALGLAVLCGCAPMIAGAVGGALVVHHHDRGLHNGYCQNHFDPEHCMRK